MGVSVATECLMQKSLEEVVGLAKGFQLSGAKDLMAVNETGESLLCG
jgi:hypothetical protein